MSIKANNLTEIAGLKAGQRVIQVDGKWVAVGVGCKPGGGESEPVDLSFVTATADKILTGYTGADQQGNEVPGTMPISTVTETSEKVTVTKGYLGENKEFAVSSGGGTDTSDANVKDTDMIMGAIAYGKNGKVYGSRKYVEDGTVYFNQGNLCTSEPVYLDPNNPVTIYSFDAFTDPQYIAEGYKVYVGGGLVEGTMIRLGAGNINIMEGGLFSIPYMGYFEYANFPMTSIPGVGDLAAENIAYGKTICGIKGTHGGSIPGNQNNYVMPDDFTENIKLVFWKNYVPVKEITMLYTSGSGNSRVWRSSVAEPYWEIYNSSGDLWLLYYSVFPTATNSKLQKHGWSYGDSSTADDGTAFDFISLEDSTWISGPIASTPV